MISVIDSFDLSKNAPLDSRTVVADTTARLAITWVYKGLLAYQVDTSTIYKYTGTPPSNLSGDWTATLSAGTAGAPGSVWYDGSGAPSSGLGIVGDYYLDTASGDTYHKTGVSTWAVVGNIKGPTGASGTAAGAYGAILITAGATTQAMTTTPAKLINFTANGSYSGATPDYTNNKITVPTSGDYILHFNSDIIFTGSHVYTFIMYINGSPTEVQTTCNSASDTTNRVCFSGPIHISGSNAVIEIYGTVNTGTNNITLVTSELYVMGINAKGDTGVPGIALIHTEADITLNDAKVTAVQGGSWTPVAPWSASIASDSRSSLSIPAAITGNKVGHSISYNGTTWSDNGVWRGPTGAAGAPGVSPSIAIVGTNGVTVSSVTGGGLTTYTVQETIPVLISGTNSGQTDIPDRLNYSDFGNLSYNIRLGTAKGGTVIWVVGQAGFTGVCQGVAGCGVSYSGTLYTAGNIVPLNNDNIYSFVAFKQNDGVGNWTIMVPCRYVNPPVTSVNGLTGAVTLSIPNLTDVVPATGAQQPATTNLSTVGGTIGLSKNYPSVSYVSTNYVIPCIEFGYSFIVSGAADRDVTVEIDASYDNSTFFTIKSQTCRLQNGILYQGTISAVDRIYAISGTLVWYRCRISNSVSNIQFGNGCDYTIYGVLKGGS